jgi:spore maturation protein CgeB
MNFVVFGLSISSSWGNGHATLWRGLSRALARRSHRLHFFERDLPYYRAARDFFEIEQGELVFYDAWDDVRGRAERVLREADAAIVTSFCPDGALAAELVLERTRGLRVFYDLDTPVTLAALEAGTPPPYLPKSGLVEFDLVLSFTGGRALTALEERLGARRVAPLYGHVDPSVHRKVAADARFGGELSYLGTYAPDREHALNELFFRPAERMSGSTFVLAGSQYPEAAWPANVVHHPHVAPDLHPSLFCSSRATLNVTRRTMAQFGHCPSGRLFEASACGATLLSDWFEGLDAFFDPRSEIFIAKRSEDVLDVLSLSDAELALRAEAARERTLTCHTADVRARRLEQLLWSGSTAETTTAPAAAAEG